MTEVKNKRVPFPLNRRSFLGIAGSFSLAAAVGWRPTLAAAKPRVVVIGAGAGGAVAAKTLARMAGDSLHITIIDRSSLYQAPFFSERLLVGVWNAEFMTMDSLSSCKALGIETVLGNVAAIDRAAKQVRLDDGAALPYDYLIASPGIDFAAVQKEGYDPEVMPHGWLADGGVNDLADQIRAMPDDGRIVMTIPTRPYRCPAGPYSRATGIAHYLKENKPNARLIMLDDENSFIMQALFEAAWADNYDSLIEWLPVDLHGGVSGYSGGPGEFTIHTDLEDIEAQVVNAIPLQQASDLLLSIGLGNSDHWCPVDMDFRSTIDPAIFIVGDCAQASPMAKAAESAFLQAERAARALLNELGHGVEQIGHGISGCWSYVTEGDTIYHREDYVFSDHIELAEIRENGVEETAEQRAESESLAEEWFEHARGLIG